MDSKINLSRKFIKDLSKRDYQEIVSLEQKIFKIPKKDIIQSVSTRLYVDMYRVYLTGELIGVIGLQWFEINKGVVLYIGNAAIDPSYQRRGLLTTSIRHAILKTHWKYMGIPKYAAGLISSPSAYNRFAKSAEFWPKKDTKTPFCIESVMREFLEQANFKICSYKGNGTYLVSLRPEKIFNLDIMSQNINKDTAWFLKNNFDCENGTEMLVLAKINLKSILGELAFFFFSAFRRAIYSKKKS